MIEQLELAGVRPSDHKYLRLFEDWLEAKQRGEKVAYIVVCLVERYGVSVRTVYDVVKRLESDCKCVSPGSSVEMPQNSQKRPNFALNDTK